MSAQDRFDIRPVVLEGKYVRLEPLSLGHIDALYAAGNDESIWKWVSVGPRTREDFARWVEVALTGRDAGTELPFTTIDLASGDVVGSTRYLEISPRDRRLEIGWTWLTPSAQRTRINTEAKYLQLRHCFEELGCLRVEWKTDARNEKSRAAIARLGAKEEGTFRKHMLSQHGFQRDSVFFSMIDDEWPEAKARLEAMLHR
ncbi:MAG: GNAT family N-acetyltransferase [Chloroflexota bacterium]|nr:GNAT family N-acetyltransferase [Chloroflexota bacterium]